MKNLFALIVIIPILFCGCIKNAVDKPTPIAVYTIGSGGNCTGATVSGRFVADTALTGANTVTITVDVSLAGPYLITTNTVNGISFSNTSTFTSTGTQTVVLTGAGTPVAVDTADFTVSAPTGLGDSCTFSVATVKGTPPHYYLTCFLNGAYRNFGDSASATNSSSPGNSGAPGLDVSGLDTVVNSTSKIEFGVSNTGGVGAGTYTDTTSTAKAYFSYVDSLAQTWTVNSGSQPSFTIVVAGVSATYVQGTFSGTIKNQQGTGTDSITVTNGLFSVPVK
jgi:hypothetical protein